MRLSSPLHTYIHTYIYEIYNALHSRGWLESEARAVARWRGLGRNEREVECFKPAFECTDGRSVSNRERDGIPNENR